MRTPSALQKFIQLFSWEQSFLCSKMAALRVTLSMPISAAAYSEEPILQTLGFQRFLPTVKYIINLGVMPAWAFAGHPSPKTSHPKNSVPDNSCD